MMKFKTFWALLVALALFASACGSDTDAVSEPEEDAATTTTEAAAAPEETEAPTTPADTTSRPTASARPREFNPSRT